MRYFMYYKDPYKIRGRTYYNVTLLVKIWIFSTQNRKSFFPLLKLLILLSYMLLKKWVLFQLQAPITVKQLI